MDIFEEKSASPMLIAGMQDPFDSPDFIYEPKLDGERCLAYLDSSGTVLQNERKLVLNSRYPELAGLHEMVKDRCILDGELTVTAAGRRRARFTAFDILYAGNHQTTQFTLTQRKKLLNETIKRESGVFALSRIIDENGVNLYDFAAKRELEGVVAKKKDSLYYMGKRTKDWIRFRNLQDDDFIVLGYLEKGGVTSVILGQYMGGRIVKKGHVALGTSREDFQAISQLPHAAPSVYPSKDEGGAVWVEPKLVCTVKYIEKTSEGGLKQPIYQGLRDDKAPKGCVADRRPGPQ